MHFMSVPPYNEPRGLARWLAPRARRHSMPRCCCAYAVAECLKKMTVSDGSASVDDCIHFYEIHKVHPAASHACNYGTCPPSLPTPLRRQSENDAKLAQELGQLQPFIAVFLLESMGQLASFGPT